MSWRPVNVARTGRLAALLLLLLAAWNPSLPSGRTAQHVIVMIDQSASMDRDWLAGAWEALRERLTELPAGSRVSLVRFGGDQRLEWQGEAVPVVLPPHIPQSGPVDMTVTDLSAALRMAASLRDPVRANRMLLLSDGRDNGPNADRTVHGTGPGGPPVLWWRPVQARRAGAAIAALHNPLSLAAGEPLTLLVRLAGAASPQTRLEVRIDGEVAAVRRVEAGHAGPVPIALPSPGPGLHRVEVNLAERETVIDRRLTSVQVEGVSRVLAISGAAPATPLVGSLAAGGWPVTAISAQQADSSLLDTADVVVLDDVAVGDLPTAMWEALAQRVRGRGLGLIVLGGARSFAAGAYRDSTLEGLLPLTAQAPEPLPPAAVLFLIDQSGSMGRQAGSLQVTRLGLAQRAVIETATTLQPGDLVGLITFAMQPRERLPLMPRREALEALRGELDLDAQGGTRLAPALRRGLQRLAASDVETRLLVVVTDGVLDESDELMRAAVREVDADIRIVALAVGAEAQIGPLQRLADAGDAELLRVTEVARLPRLMQQSVDQLRAPVETGPLRPVAVDRPPFLATAPPSWPILDAYAVARPRPGAAVYLAAPNGDPLLAGWHAGTGRVLALPGGLGRWAASWTDWEHWGALAGGLVEWAAGGHAGNLDLAARREGAAFAFTLQAVDDAGQWLDGRPVVTLTGPGGTPAEIAVSPEAPGSYRLRPAHTAPGRYDIAIGLDGRSRHLAYLFEPAAETAAGTPVAPYLLSALADGGVQLWRPTDGWPGPAGRASARVPLLALALFIFVATLVVERGLHARLLQRLRSQTYGLKRRWL